MNRIITMISAFTSALPAFACEVSNWTDLGPTPLPDFYIPQGLAHDEHGLLLTVYSKSETPIVRIFRYSEDWIELSGDTAPLAHTSGIVPYRDIFFLIDFETGFIARAKITKTSIKMEAVFETDYNNISAGFISDRGNKELLYVSTFGLFGLYRVFDASLLYVEDSRHVDQITSIPGHRFIQGNYSDGDIILQARNRLGKDIIDVGRLTKGGEMQLVHQFTYPGRMIEDVTVMDGDIFTTDEWSFRLYSREFNFC